MNSPTTDRRVARIAECRRLAALSLDLAQASLLAHVRERHEVAAARWLALAKLDEDALLT